MAKYILPEEQETLIILPYKGSAAQGDEIRLALSCWRKFCKFDYRFVVIGEFDENLIQEFPWVEFIKLDCVEKRDNQYNPHLDMMNKIEYAYNLFKDTYLGFIWMVDDNYAIKPFDLTDIMTVHYHEPSFVGWKDLPTSYWKHDKWKTRHTAYKLHHPLSLLFRF